MKLTAEECTKALMLLAKTDRSTDEQTELEALQAKAGDSPEDLFNEIKSLTGGGDDEEDCDDDDKPMTEADVKSIVEEAVKAGIEGTGLNAEAIVKMITDSAGDEPLKIEDVTKALADNTPEPVDVAALTKSITDQIKIKPGLDEEAAKKIFGDLFEERSKSKMQHQNVTVPTNGSRVGNMTVAQKQLCNSILMKVSDEWVPREKKPVHMNENIPESLLADAMSAGTKSINDMKEAIYMNKDLTTSGSGTGLELIPTDLSSDLQRRLYLRSQVATAMLAREIQMPSDPYKLPISTTLPSFYVGSEGGTPTESTPGTDDVTLETVKLIGKTQVSYEIDEDSLIPVLPMVTQGMVTGAAKSFEGAVLSGDTSATHQDSDYHAVTNHYATAFKGWRFYGLAQAETKASWATGGISADNISGLRKLMGAYGVNPSELMLICGPKGYNDLINLDETLTVDKVGPQARIISGTSASVFGIPIVVSEECRENLNASGVYDGTTVTKGSVILVNTMNWLIGTRRGFTVETDRDISTQLIDVVASFRREMEPIEVPSATITSVAVAYNYDA